MVTGNRESSDTCHPSPLLKRKSPSPQTGTRGSEKPSWYHPGSPAQVPTSETLGTTDSRLETTEKALPDLWSAVYGPRSVPHARPCNGSTRDPLLAPLSWIRLGGDIHCAVRSPVLSYSGSLETYLAATRPRQRLSRMENSLSYYTAFKRGSSNRRHGRGGLDRRALSAEQLQPVKEQESRDERQPERHAAECQRDHGGLRHR